MAEGGLDSVVGEVSEVSDSTSICGCCETSLSNYKTTFLCQTCQPNDRNHYLCQFCVVMHVRKSHQVTDQNRALVEVCEKDKNVAMFLCKTCDLKMFCYTCFKDHSGHDFAECSECDDEMKQILGRVHGSLSRFDGIYKRAAKYADIAKTNETRFSEFCDVYNSDYIQRDLEKIWTEALNGRKITDKFAENRKTLETMSGHVELLNKAVEEVGDSQVQLRYLANLEGKQNQPNVLTVPKVADRDVESYRKNLDEKRAFLIEQLRPLVLEYVGNFKFRKVECLEVDLHDLTGEFNLLKLPLECTEIKIAGTKFGLLLACRVGDQFSVYRVSEPAKDAQFLNYVPAKHLWLSGAGKYECIALYPHNYLHGKLEEKPKRVHCFLNGKNTSHTLRRPVNRSELVGLFHFGNGILFPLTITGSQGNWKLKLGSSVKSFVEKPYSYDSMLLQRHWIYHIFISGGQMFLYCDDNPDGYYGEDNSLTGKAQLKVPCCENGDEHHGKFGCGFVEDHLRPTHLLLGLWCLQYKVLEVWGANERKKCFVVSINNTVKYCDNIYNIF